MGAPGTVVGHKPLTAVMPQRLVAETSGSMGWVVPPSDAYARSTERRAGLGDQCHRGIVSGRPVERYLDRLMAAALLDGVEVPTVVDKPANVQVTSVVDAGSLVQPGLARALGERQRIGILDLANRPNRIVLVGGCSPQRLAATIAGGHPSPVGVAVRMKRPSRIVRSTSTVRYSGGAYHMAGSLKSESKLAWSIPGAGTPCLRMWSRAGFSRGGTPRYTVPSPARRARPCFISAVVT